MREESNHQLLPLAVVIAGALIAAAVYFGGGGHNPLSSSGGTDTKQDPTVIADVSTKDHIIGDPGAKVKIIEYSDLECPFCKVFHGTLHQLMDTYKGQSVAWIFRPFPIVELHSRAPKEAEAAECAAEQGGNGAFWNFIDKVFATTQSNDTLDPSSLPEIAKAVGLDANLFTSCLNSGKYKDVIDQDVAAALKAGALGTPYTIVQSGGQNVVVSGAQDYDTVKAAVDNLLK